MNIILFMNLQKFIQKLPRLCHYITTMDHKVFYKSKPLCTKNSRKIANTTSSKIALPSKHNKQSLPSSFSVVWPFSCICIVSNSFPFLRNDIWTSSSSSSVSSGSSSSSFVHHVNRWSYRKIKCTYQRFIGKSFIIKKFWFTNIICFYL